MTAREWGVWVGEMGKALWSARGSFDALLLVVGLSAMRVATERLNARRWRGFR